MENFPKLSSDHKSLKIKFREWKRNRQDPGEFILKFIKVGVTQESIYKMANGRSHPEKALM